MKKLLHILITILLTQTILTAQQPIKELENWATQQTEGFDAGEVVEFLNGSREPGEITFGSSYMFHTNPGYLSSTALDETHFVIAYGNGNYADGAATIGIVSGNTISYGSEFTFSTGYATTISVTTLDSNHFVISYFEKTNYNNNVGVSIVGTVTGSNIAFGSDYIFINDNVEEIKSVALTASSFVIAYQDNGNSYCGTAIVGTVSGTTISFGSEFTFNSERTSHISLACLDTNNFIVAYQDWGNSYFGTTKLGIVSGNTISYGTSIVFNNASTSYISAATFNPVSFVLTYRDYGSSTHGSSIAGIILNGNISFGTEFVFNNASCSDISATSLDTAHFVVAYRDHGNSYFGTAKVGTLSGTNISYGTESIFNSEKTHSISANTLNGTNFVTVSKNSTIPFYGLATVGTVLGITNTVTTAPSQTTCAGIVTIPITVQNLDDVTDFSIILDYGTANLTYTGFQNTNTQLNSGTLTVTENNGEITIAWNSTTAANITTGTLLELQFTASASYTQNIENLTWDENSSYYEDSNGDNLSTVFNNGQVTIEPITDGAGPITGSNNVCQGTTSESYQVGAIANATSYIWELIPTNSGTINGSGTNITVDYSATFSGQTILSVYGSNSCGNGPPSSVVITIAPSPTANANVDDTVCENSTYTLSGTATNQQSILWTTSGDGTFDDATSLIAVYTPGSNDIASGSTTLTLTAYAIAPCATDAVDNMTLTIQPQPTANTGSNDTIGDNSTYTLSGTATNQQSILWTTAGDGTFDDAALLNATYTPGNNDIATGSAILTLTAYAITPCATNASDNMTLYIQPSQQISLINGWNIGSFYVVPNNIDLLNILQPLVTSAELTKVIDEQGNFIQEIPGSGWMNTIGNMANTEGYYIKVNQNTQLDLFGTLVDTPFDIPLSTGWNIMGYPVQDTTNAITVLQPLIDSSYLTKVIDEAGGFVQEIPGSGWMNTIGDFMHGEGYYIKVNQNCTLTIGREAPTVTTDNATSITYYSATSGGNVTFNGGAPVTARGVCWSTSSNPTLADSYTTDGVGIDTFVSNITGLTANTQYYVRAYATNAEGTNYGNEITFTTSSPILAIVTTNSVTNIMATTATSGGNVTSNGGATVTARGVCWSTYSNPTLANSYTTDGTGTGTFTSNLTGLSENSTYYVRAYATNNVGTVYGNEVSFVATLPPFPCGNQLTYEGQSYTTVQIGTQCWMAENLNVGTRIDGTNSQTDNSTIEKYCFNNNPVNCDVYGGLYQWNEMMQYTTTQGVQGICPSGWHLPTDDEWKTMEMQLGMTQAQADAIGWRGTDQGSQMKSTSGWYNNGNGTNSSGFTALPGGYRNSNGSFYNLGNNGNWWSSSENSGTNAWYRHLHYDNDQVGRYRNYYKTHGFSVRCLKN